MRLSIPMHSKLTSLPPRMRNLKVASFSRSLTSYKHKRHSIMSTITSHMTDLAQRGHWEVDVVFTEELPKREAFITSGKR